MEYLASRSLSNGVSSSLTGSWRLSSGTAKENARAVASNNSASGSWVSTLSRGAVCADCGNSWKPDQPKFAGKRKLYKQVNPKTEQVRTFNHFALFYLQWIFGEQIELVPTMSYLFDATIVSHHPLPFVPWGGSAGAGGPSAGTTAW